MAETGDAVKSVTSFPEDIRSCSTSKVFFFLFILQSTKGCWVLSSCGSLWEGTYLIGNQKTRPFLDLQLSLSPQHQNLVWFAVGDCKTEVACQENHLLAPLNALQKKYDAHISCFHNESKEMLMQLREEMGRSLRRETCHTHTMPISKRQRDDRR